MVKFNADLRPDGGRVTYGFDPTLGGFWAEIRRPGRKKVEYDALHPVEFNFQRPLEGLLYFLVKHGVFSEEELNDALLHLELPVARGLSPSAKLAVEVVVRLRSVASD